MSTRIFFCGEVVADLIEKQQGSGDFKLTLGGSQYNATVGASRATKRDNLDIQIGFVGPLSNDMFGDRFMKVLQDLGTDTSGIKRVDRNITLAIISIRPGMENAFSFYGRDTAEQMTKIDDLPASLGSDKDNNICFFGSISTVLEPARFAWIDFATRQRSKSLMLYDLNTRPSIARDPERYRSLVLEWASLAHIMKASDADIGWAYPGMSMKEIADIWLDRGASMAVFTKGKDGSEAYTRKTSASAETTDLIAPNTVGAGDNFNAGLALELAKKKCFIPDDIEQLSEVDLAIILQGANSTAAHHLMGNGATPRAAETLQKKTA